MFAKRQTSDTNENQPPSKKKKIIPGFVGHMYEAKLFLLFICRGINSNYDFEIGTEIEEGDKFDDIILKCTQHNSSDGKFSIIVQAKHSTNLDKKIDIKKMFKEHSGDFGICKYYYSYQKAKQDFLFNDHPIKFAMLITNMKFEDNDGRENLETVSLSHELCLVHSEERGIIHRFKKDIILPVLKIALNEYTTKMIATELIDSMIDKQNRSEYFISKYHRELFTEVIDPASKKFRSDFIQERNSDSEELKKLRSELNSCLKKKSLDLERVLSDKNWKKKEFIFKDEFLRNELSKSEMIEHRPFADILNDEEIEDFLKIFMIATGEPAENELDELIEDELKKEFPNDLIAKILTLKMVNWITGSLNISNSANDVRFITPGNIKELLTEEDRKINEKLFQGHLTELNRINDMNFLLDGNVMIKNLDIFFKSDNEMKVFNVVSKCTTLTAVKIYKHFKNQCIFTKLSSLFEPSNNIFSYFLNKFCDHRLLLIECDENNTNNLCKDKLINVLNSNSDKKVILIGLENNIFSSTFKTKFLSQNQFQECFDEEFNMDQLTVDSRSIFYEKCSVEFQGSSVKFNEISSDNTKKAINGSNFIEYLKGKELEIGKSIEDMEKIQEYYINRKFVTRINIDKYTIVYIIEDDDDLFSHEWKFTRIENSLQHPISEEETLYIRRQKMREVLNKICILRKKQGNVYLLYKTSGLSLESHTIGEKIKEHYNTNITLLSSDPGMGKSYVFNYLCRRTKIKNPTLWVSKVDLKSSSNVLKEIPKNKDPDASDDLIKFFNATLNKRSIEQIFFQDFLKEGKVILFFDGFDEISPSYKTVTIDLIKSLNKYSNKNRIFISSRPHYDILDSINDTFEVSSYALLPFSKADQMVFFQKYWKFNLKDIEFEDEKFRSFANKLISQFEISLKNSYTEFLETPLQTMMIAALFENEFKIFIDSKSDIDDKSFSEGKLSGSLKLTSLYKNFVKMKCGEKLGIDTNSEISMFAIENIYEKKIEHYQVLSLKYLFSNYDIDLILKDRGQDVLKSSQIEVDRIGIVIFENNYHRFVHLTYAEYFAAMYIVNNMNRISVVEFFLSKILVQENKMICSFINDILCDGDNKMYNIPEMKSLIENKLGDKLHFAIHNSWREITRYLLNNNVDLMHINYRKENVFHLACENSDQFILSMILEKIKNDSEKFKVFLKMKRDNNLKETPLLLIARYGSSDNIKKMFGIFEVKFSENEIFHVDEHRNNILYYSIMNRNLDTLKFVIENFRNERETFESLIRFESIWGRSPFLHAVQIGNVEKVSYILNSLEDFKCWKTTIVSVDRNNDNILHIAAENEIVEVFRFIIDELKDRTEIFKSLIFTKGSEGCSPLLYVAKYGGVEQMSYLLDTLNDLDYSEDAIKSIDRHDDNILHAAAENKIAEVFRCVVEKLKSRKETFESLISSKNDSGSTPLICASLWCNFANVSLIFDTLKDFDLLDDALWYVDDHNDSILHGAAQNEDVAVLPFVVHHLVENRRDFFESLVRSKGFDGLSPLLRAVRYGKMENVNCLFDVLRKFGLFESAVLECDVFGKKILQLAVLNSDAQVLLCVEKKLEFFSTDKYSRNCNFHELC